MGILKKIVEQYLDDDYSRIMPGRKDVKSVKQVGDKRVRVQKRLLLMNIIDNHACIMKRSFSYPPSNVLRSDLLK